MINVINFFLHKDVDHIKLKINQNNFIRIYGIDCSSKMIISS